MHLIQRMKIWKELRQLEQRAREEPSPSTFVDLGQVYINLDLHEKAQRVAEDGLALFPKSTELRQLLEFARTGLRRLRASELRAKATRHPSTKIYRELAQVQLELGDSGALSTTCQEWTVRFPDDAGAWLIMGQARLLGFYRDLAAREGLEAVRCLEKAVAMNAADDHSHRLLGEVFYRIGAVQKATGHLQALQKLVADDPEVAALLHYVSGLQDRGDDIAKLLEEVEEHGSLLHPSMAASRPSGQGDEQLVRARDGLAHVAEMRGVRKATFIKGSKALVKGEIHDGRDPFLRIVRVIAKSAHRFARRLDIGNASKSIVDVDGGHVCVCVYGDVLAAVLCDRNTDLERVIDELQEIVAGALYATEGHEA
ncbi:MAG: hypothetical protein KDC48_05170 [Planctomycetes bacterium]|nr:hypothetical protein [Planctomycetota bacterium]